MYQTLKKHADDLSQALLKVCTKDEDVHCNVDLGKTFTPMSIRLTDVCRFVSLRKLKETT